MLSVKNDATKQKTSEKMIKDFKKKVKDSHYLNELKKSGRFYGKKPTKIKIRGAAIAREKYRAIRKKQAMSA